MSDFYERFGQLTVADAIKLNECAKQTCEFEMTSQTGDVNNNGKEYND